MKNSLKLIAKYKWWVLGGVLVLFLFFFLRLFNLTILPVFADEAIYVRWSQVMRAEPSLRFLPLSDGKQPLFMWATIPLLKVFKDPLLAGRFLSVLSGFLSLIGIALISWRLFRDRWMVFLATLLYSVLPFFVFFDRLALVDSMLLMFGLGLVYFGLRFIEKPQLSFSFILGFILAGGLLTKSPAVFFALLIPTLFFFFQFKKEKKESYFKKYLRIFSLLAIVYLLGFGIYNFLLRLGPGFEMIAIRNKDYLFSVKEILSHPLDPLKPHLGDLGEWFSSLFGKTVMVFTFVGVVIGLWKKTRISFFLLAWFLAPLLAQAVFAKVFTPRYILFTVWPLIIFAAFGLKLFFAVIKEAFKGKSFKILLVIFIVLLLFYPLAFNYQLIFNPQRANLPRNLRSGHLEDWTAGQGIKESSIILREKAQEGNVLVGTEGYFGTLPDGLQIYLEGIPQITVIGVGYPITGVSQSLINSLVDNDVYLMVNQNRLKIKPEENGLILIEEYPKATNPSGFQDKLLLFNLDRDFFKE